MTLKTLLATAMAFMLNTAFVQADTYNVGRQNLLIPDDKNDRPLTGYVWYPTQQSHGQIEAHGNAVWEGISVIPDAAPDPGRHPFVALSHGMFGNAQNQVWLAEALVQKGYVVAAIDHPGTSTFLRDPKDQRELWERPKDITRVIDYVIESPDFSPVIDQDHIFMAGHSLGGFTAIALAGGRYAPDQFDAFCHDHPDELVCGIFDRWNVAKSSEDRQQISADLSDPRISGFAVFDLGGTQSFSPESLGHIDRPILVFGAPLDIMGMNLDLESRALIELLPKENTQYREPETLSHFDFLGVCTARGLEILKAEEPEDAFVCTEGREKRRAEHTQIASDVANFFEALK